jgi:hypothetical protein
LPLPPLDPDLLRRDPGELVRRGNLALRGPHHPLATPPASLPRD